MGNVIGDIRDIIAEGRKVFPDCEIWYACVPNSTWSHFQSLLSEKGYGRRNLYNMVAVYDSFSSNEFAELLRRSGQFVQPVAAQIIEASEIVQPTAGQLSDDMNFSEENI